MPYSAHCRETTERMTTMSGERTVLLFSYGTLQQDDVQLSSFGRLLEGQADAMPDTANP